MKYLIMCEGQNEQVIMNLLLDNNKLKIKIDDLIGRKPYYGRQLTNKVIITDLKLYSLPVKVLRIGDVQSDKLEIPKDLEYMISKNNIYKYCTKPELEILLIINEKLYDNYNKEKNKIKAKNYAKANISYSGRMYDNTCSFIESYYGGKKVEKLVSNIKEYKRRKKHNKNELYLADLLK